MPMFGHAQVVISEVYTTGGESGAALRHDFVELYNSSDAAISLTNYSVQFNPVNGGGNYNVAALGNVSIPAHGYFLVRFASAGANGAVLPVAPDATSTIDLESAGGRIALVNSIAQLSNSAEANDPGIVDFVGYGGVAKYEGAGVAPLPTLTSSIERKAGPMSTSASMAVGGAEQFQGNGYDSNNNNFDFVLRPVPQPQNSASAAEITTQATVFYSKATGALNILTNFSSTPDGTGPPPTSFSKNLQVFNITGSNRTIAGNLTVSGTNAKVVLGTNASFTVPASANFTGTMDLSSGSTLVQLNAAPAVTFGTVDASSTVEFAQATAYTVPILGGPGYGNLTLRNATKLLSASTTVVRGALLVGTTGGGTTTVGGAAASASILNLAGNFTLAGTVNFTTAADEHISLVATNTTIPQVLNGGGNTIKLFKVTLPASQAGLSLATGTSNLELGTSAGGGYELATGRRLTVNNNTLSFSQGSDATISGSGTGTLTLSPTSNLVFNKIGTATLGTLRLTAGAAELNNFTLNTAGPMTLGTSMTVQGTLALTSGQLLVGNTTLTLNGPITTTNGVLQGNAAGNAKLTIGGSGAISSLKLGASVAGRTFGTFTLNRSGTTLLTSSLIIENALFLNAGILSLNGNALTLNGSVTSTAGLLSGSTTSNLIVNPGIGGPVGSLAFAAPSTGRVLRDLQLNRPNGTLEIASGTLDVRTLTMTSGVLKIGDGVTLNLTGSLITDPTQARFAGTLVGGLPTANLAILGNSNIGPLGVISFVPGQASLNSFTINRAGPVIQTAELENTLVVKFLTLTRGIVFVRGTARVEVLPSGTVTGGGANSYINALTLPVVTNTGTLSVSKSFPLGHSGQYRPLILTVTDAAAATTSYTARQFEAPSPVRQLPATLARVSPLRYYNVVQESANTSQLVSASIRLTYDPATDLVSTGTNSLLRIAKTDPANGSKWLDIGGTGTGSFITSTVPFGPVLGDFTLGTDINTPPNINPLPVELVRFAAARQASSVLLSWATASEKNSASFEVQRSFDGQSFASVASVAAHGTTSQAHTYSALDIEAPASLLYYRLRQVDIDGTVAYSPVVTVAASRGAAGLGELTVYPNPATDQLMASLPAAAGRTYRVVNALGQVLAQGSADAANPSVDVRRLAAGTYFLEMHTAAGRQVRRFVKHD
ncbi:T9SS type A sorting domain-containing protein [Hymenobacter jeongseonensis]|nr:T9SS type A sorting domain-containing protein [Hymenobacter jeongseonensis]